MTGESQTSVNSPSRWNEQGSAVSPLNRRKGPAFGLALLLCWMLAAQPVGQHPLIVCGGAADTNFVGASRPGGIACPAGTLCTWTYTDTSLPAEWPTLRYGPLIHYRLSVPVGLYVGMLHFVEPNKSAAGQRLMTAVVNGSPASDPIDVWSLAGGAKDAHYGWVFFADAATGIVDVQLNGLNGQNAILSGLEILTQEAGVTCQQPPGTPYDFQPGFCYPRLRLWFQDGPPFTAQGQ